MRLIGPTSFGSDPEFMVLNRATGKFVSAIPILKHSKNNKLQLTASSSKLFYDNVLLEVNLPSSPGIEEFVNGARRTFQDAAKKLGPDFAMVPRSSHTFDMSECKHRDALTFGCDAEYDAWELNSEGKVKRIDAPQVADGFRSCGGHLHVGHDRACLKKGGDPIPLVRFMDLFVGVPSVLINHDPTSVARNQIYGRPGSHRITDYGVEYRVMPNFWLAGPMLVRAILQLTVTAVTFFENNHRDFVIEIASEAEIKAAIKGDKEMASNILGRLRRHISGNTRDLIQTLMQPKAYDFYNEWDINLEAMAEIDSVLQASI